MNKLPYKIMLDRYAEKDLTKTSIRVGSIVIATVDESNPLYPQKEVCKVLEYFIKDDLYELVNLYDWEDKYMLPIDKIQVPLETTPEQIWDRMALGNAQNEKEEDRELYIQQFKHLLYDWKFVPGGRVMAMLGATNQNNLTAYNCFVLPCPKDSRQGTIETLGNMVEMMSRGGGVGINLSSLRPKNAVVRGVHGTSSGAVSWGGGYSYYTGLVEQGGSRRGALLLGLSVSHPDIEEFIDAKSVSGKITNANLSVLISDDFMKCVEEDLDWWLSFPDTSFPCYDKEWDGNLSKWQAKSYPCIAYKKVRARDLWMKIMESNWKSAEPGIIFIERYNKMSNSWYLDEVICTNPCGEQGLPPWGVCNLGHINLSRVPVINGNLDWNTLEDIINLAIRFMDNIIDITPYFFEENKKVQLGQRRIGMGTMGMAELLIKLNIRYGSEESLKFIDALYKFIRNKSYEASVNLAEEKGAFPDFIAEKYCDGKFIKQLPRELREKIFDIGIRNVSTLTQAPTGSGGTMCETSTGIEPFYDWEYTRKGRLGTEIQYVNIVQEHINSVKELKGIDENGKYILPNYFVTAKELTPEEHIKVMAKIQEYTDSSISKTVNCPENFTVEEVDKLYRLAYELGCKGLTIYRDKSRDSQVLESIGTTKVEEKKFALPTKWGEVMKVPKDTIYRKVKFRTGCGKIKMMIGTSESLGHRVIDAYVIVSSAGGCHLNIQGEAIAISRYLRAGGKIEDLVEDSTDVGVCPSYQFQRGKGHQDLYGKSCFNGLIKAIVAFESGTLPEYVEVEGPPKKEYVKPTIEKLDEDKSICPGCGTIMINETGCWNCKTCGFTKCGG